MGTVDCAIASNATTLDCRGSGNLTYGDAGEATIRSTGMGSVTVRRAAGERLSLTQTGSGSVTVGGGSVTALSIKADGMGSVTCKAVAQHASVVGSGTGTVAIAKPQTIDRLEMSGMGKLRYLP
jgi:hypothetical protein